MQKKPNVLKMYKNQPRHIQTFLTRSRTGHIVTQVYLHHFHITDTPTCLWCNIYDTHSAILPIHKPQKKQVKVISTSWRRNSSAVYIDWILAAGTLIKIPLISHEEQELKWLQWTIVDLLPFIVHVIAQPFFKLRMPRFLVAKCPTITISSQVAFYFLRLSRIQLSLTSYVLPIAWFPMFSASSDILSFSFAVNEW